MLESTRDTIAIRHATNGTAEKTIVDTNPQKVLEHENLVSDSEYITLDHETDVNKTHIKTAALKQQLDALYETISSIGGGATSTIQFFSDTNFTAYKHLVQTSDGAALLTFSFECYNAAETVLTGELKGELESYVLQNTSISNAAITITNDGTTMKLINSAPSDNVTQHATFTFTGNTGS